MLALLSGTVAPLAAGNCLQANSWICWDYVTSRSSLIKHALWQHVTLSALSLGLALIVAFPLALLALRTKWLRASVLGILGIIYTIPSLSLFVLLQPAFGVTHATPVVIALIAYAQLLLVRNVVVGLEEVPADVLDAAKGMGYGRARLLFSVRMPLAMPAIMAGLRVTTVSTIALLTVGGLIQQGGLGNLLVDGFSNSFNAQVFTSIVLIVALALLADLLLLLVQRLLTPWDRKRRHIKQVVQTGAVA